MYVGKNVQRHCVYWLEIIEYCVLLHCLILIATDIYDSSAQNTALFLLKGLFEIIFYMIKISLPINAIIMK